MFYLCFDYISPFRRQGGAAQCLGRGPVRPGRRSWRCAPQALSNLAQSRISGSRARPTADGDEFAGSAKVLTCCARACETFNKHLINKNIIIND